MGTVKLLNQVRNDSARGIGTKQFSPNCELF